MLEKMNQINNLLNDGMMTKDLLIKEVYDKNRELNEISTKYYEIQNRLEQVESDYEGQINRMKIRIEDMYKDSDKDTTEAK